MPALHIHKLGRQHYQPVWQAMQALNSRWDGQDQLWLVEHPPVYTLGRAGKAEHVLNPADIPVIKTDRGGQVTYHGPGQIIIYCLIDIKKAAIGVRPLVTRIEQAIIQTLEQLNITSQARADAPGVYVNGAKIAALGLRIKNGRSYHGLSLNYQMDLRPFDGINPCGYENLAVCQVSDFVAIERQKLEEKLLEALANMLGFTQTIIYSGHPLVEQEHHE